MNGHGNKVWRHKKRGTVYLEVGIATLQTAHEDGKLPDGTEMVVYRGEDGKLWVRARLEFDDGRFELLGW